MLVMVVRCSVVLRFCVMVMNGAVIFPGGIAVVFVPVLEFGIKDTVSDDSVQTQDHGTTFNVVVCGRRSNVVCTNHNEQ